MVTNVIHERTEVQVWTLVNSKALRFEDRDGLTGKKLRLARIHQRIGERISMNAGRDPQNYEFD